MPRLSASKKASKKAHPLVFAIKQAQHLGMTPSVRKPKPTAGALRAAIREWTGGECVFFQGAAGNVLPLVCFTDSEDEAARMVR